MFSRYDAIMKKTEIVVLVLYVISQLHETSFASQTEEELEVILQFFEYELEDICIAKSEALWDFLTGSKTDLKEVSFLFFLFFF